ncbi:MAG: DUF177 domain-containing protein [Balneolaceae bacterium]|nr:DUF177 domain-containing protein [Balneolaceae bacterium]MDR9408843.1 DUF177 domain-containing protein [Balneolaceae bacterium]
METSKLTFELQEIPDGKSERDVSLSEGDLELDDEITLKEGNVHVNFFRTNHFIEVDFTIDVDTELICDRSLKPFVRHLNGSYHVLFEPDNVEDTESEKGAVRQIPPEDLVLDIEKEVRDTIMLEIPVRKIHPDYLDSEGNPEDFETKHYGPEPDEDEMIDPRWAELKKLKNT